MRTIKPTQSGKREASMRSLAAWAELMGPMAGRGWEEFIPSLSRETREWRFCRPFEILDPAGSSCLFLPPAGRYCLAFGR